MREPSLRTSRLAIAGALLAIAAVGGAGFFLGRTTSPRPALSEPATTATPVPSPDPISVVERSLGRADLVELADLASDALVTGAALPDRVREAVGRRFELAMPFGCAGPASVDSQAPLRWRYDQEDETLRLHVAVTRWSATDWRLDDNDGIEAIEGFWIARPWTSSAECPRRLAEDDTPATGSGGSEERTLAVAQFLAGDVRREALREGRPFEAVLRVQQSEFAAPRGFRLVLSGRIDRVPAAGGQGGPVRCVQPGGSDQRPICVVAVTLGEVRIENSADSEVLASWPVGRD